MVNIGDKFGRLTVLEKTNQKDKARHYYYRCKCECGNEVLVPAFRLTNGITKSCGCLLTEKNKSRIKKDLCGKKFGKLIAIEPTDLRYYGDKTLWRCECDCGTKNVLVARGSLISGHTQSCGCLKSQGEELISKLLTQNNLYFEKEKSFDDCRFPDTNKLAKFDFYVNNEYLIEYDGIQHFENRSYFSESLKTRQDHDEFKNNWCKQHNITLLRIPYYQKNSLTLNDVLCNSRFKIC